MSSNLVRLSGLAAMLGGVLGIVLTPVLTYLWATYSDAYLYYGRAYFPVYLGCIAGLAGLYALRRGNLGLQGTQKLDTEKLVFGMTFVGLVVSLVGCILDYWGGTPGEDFTWVQMQGFGIEILGLMLVLFGSVAFGLTYRRANVLPTLVVWLLIAAGPGGYLVLLPARSQRNHAPVLLRLGRTGLSIVDGKGRLSRTALTRHVTEEQRCTWELCALRTSLNL